MKILITRLVELVLKLFWIIPLDNKKIVFVSFNGQQYSDSPKYIYENLLNYDYDFYWILNPEKKYEIPGRYHKIRKGTIKELLTLLSSKCIVTNNYLPTYLPIRRKQIVLNTWHGGGAFKRVGLMSKNVTDYDRWFFKEHEKKYTAFCSDSEVSEKLMIRDSFGFRGEVLRYGLPRNAILQRCDKRLINDIKQKLDINTNSTVVLYAPTFRGTASDGFFIDDTQVFDSSKIELAFKDRFENDCIVLFRGHHTFKNCFNGTFLDVTDYSDMQELLLISDVLITDFSSCMWDMALMKKPVFIYAPDLSEYVSRHGFYTDVESWPFYISKTTEKLVTNIIEHNQNEYNNKLAVYFERMNSYENVNSVKMTCDWLIKEMEIMRDEE